MSVRICGRLINWHRPIKVASYFTSLLCVFILGAMLPTSAHALDAVKGASKTPSTFSAADSCLPLLKSHAATGKFQRNAGPSSSTVMPAAMLGLALGLRTAIGPVESLAGLSETADKTGTRHALAVAAYRSCKNKTALSSMTDGESIAMR